jgi:hypothetical protein
VVRDIAIRRGSHDALYDLLTQTQGKLPALWIVRVRVRVSSAWTDCAIRTYGDKGPDGFLGARFVVKCLGPDITRPRPTRALLVVGLGGWHDWPQVFRRRVVRPSTQR